MRHKELADIALMHRDALEADQRSPKTISFYGWGLEQALRDLESLAGHEPTLGDWLDADPQRRRYREIAERERSASSGG